jgi:hypothetical protein
MERRISSLIVVAAAAGLVACGGGSSSSSKPASAAPAAQPPAASSAPVAKGDFGVPECDEYFTKYLACIDSKVPEAARATVRQSLDQTKAQWQAAASTPEGRSGLAMGCKQATEAARAAMQAYGCSF